MKNRKGFTLIELIAVVVIMAIIALLATPNIISLLEKGKKEQFVADAKEFVSKATYMYKSEKFNSVRTDDEWAGGIDITVIKGVTNDDLTGPWGGDYSGNVSITTISGIRYYFITLKTCSNSKCYNFYRVNSKELSIDKIT